MGHGEEAGEQGAGGKRERIQNYIFLLCTLPPAPLSLPHLQIIFPYNPQRSQLRRLFYMICEFHKQHQIL